VITVGSLSSGYEGIGLSLLLGGLSWQTNWFAEIDPDASRVLKTWWPEVPNLGSFADEDFWERAERCDVHVGGIPCQPFSAAGRQLGEADPRHLWPFWRRGIELQRPTAVLFENVANLTRGKMRPTFDAIIADLLALGYDVRWCILGACAVGACHHRHRVFLVGVLRKLHSGPPTARQVEVQTCGQKLPAYLPTPTARDASTRGEGSPEYWAERRAEGFVGGIPLGAALALLPTPRHSDGSNGGPNQGIASGDIALSSAVQPERWGKYAAAVARHAVVMGTLPPEPTEIGPKGGRRLAAAFSEWMMMLPAGHLTSVLDRKPALARAGNGVVPPQAMTAWSLLTHSMHRVD
jgi:DNA (cytosine-5)-methyltransferase 1